MTYSISQTTEYRPEEIIKEILSKMDYKDYEVISQTDNSLTFSGNNANNGPRSIVWYTRFHGGKFEIEDQGGQRVVRLQYQVFSIIDIIMIPIIVCGPLIIGIVNHENFGYVAASVFAALIVFNFFTLYFTAKNMLSDILF